MLLLPRDRSRGERVRAVLSGSDAVITVSEGLRTRVIELGAKAVEQLLVSCQVGRGVAVVSVELG